jgi:hypothetical protein
MNAAHDATWYSTVSRAGSGPGVALSVQGLGFGVFGQRCKIKGLGLKSIYAMRLWAWCSVQGWGFWVEGLGFRGVVPGFRVQGLGCRAQVAGCRV